MGNDSKGATVMSVFGRNLERFRLALGWERSEAADMFDISTTHEFLMEKGKKGATFATLERISEATMIPVWKFFYDKEQEQK